MSSLDRIEALAQDRYLAVYDKATGVKVFPDALVLLLVAVARAAEEAAEDGPRYASFSDIAEALGALDRYVAEHLPSDP